MRIAVVNGPSLNLLGTRQPAIYGTTTLAQIETSLREVAAGLSVELRFSQFNGEGEIIDAIHAMHGTADGLLINAGAYSHSSLAIRDALAATGVPFVEIHLTNIFAREPERRHSALAGAALGVVCGFGAMSYVLALHGIVARLSGEQIG